VNTIEFINLKVEKKNLLIKDPFGLVYFLVYPKQFMQINTFLYIIISLSRYLMIK
jgi:hypothetical protein